MADVKQSILDIATAGHASPALDSLAPQPDTVLADEHIKDFNSQRPDQASPAHFDASTQCGPDAEGAAHASPEFFDISCHEGPTVLTDADTHAGVEPHQVTLEPSKVTNHASPVLTESEPPHTGFAH
eukprot:10023187-Karenia_brevis.AAC.1